MQSEDLDTRLLCWSERYFLRPVEFWQLIVAVKIKVVIGGTCMLRVVTILIIAYCRISNGTVYFCLLYVYLMYICSKRSFEGLDFVSKTNSSAMQTLGNMHRNSFLKK